MKGLSECELNMAPELETMLSEDWPGETSRLSLATTGLNEAELNMSPELETVQSEDWPEETARLSLTTTGLNEVNLRKLCEEWPGPDKGLSWARIL